MQRKIQIASVLVPLDAGQTIEVDIPEMYGFENEFPTVVVSRYNQTTVEVIFTEEYVIIDIEEDGILEFTPDLTGNGHVDHGNT